MTIMVRPRAIDLEQLHRLHALARAHAGQRLVEQQQARRGGERQADLEPPLLAIGKLGYRHVGALGQADQRKRLLDPLREPGDAVRLRAAGRDGTVPRRSASAAIVDVLAHRQASEQLVDLVALGQPELAHFGDVDAGDVAALEDDAARTSACISQVSILKKVLLPAPFGPMMPRSSP